MGYKCNKQIRKQYPPQLEENAPCQAVLWSRGSSAGSRLAEGAKLTQEDVTAIK